MTAKRDRAIGASTQLATSVSVNFGSSLAGLLLPVVGAVVVVTARQIVTAAAVLPFYRPKLRQLSWRSLWPAVALGVILAAMNLTFYLAIGRLGLGVAVTIEFLGPLAVALASSRRVLDVVCALGAAAGVFLLTGLAGPVDGVGIGFALAAAASWAGYIVLTRRVATELPGLEGLSIASIVATVILLPVALIVIDYSALTWGVAGLLLAAGVLSSAIPYSLDTFILRRIPSRLYAIITSSSPVIGAAFGFLILSETFTAQQLLGIVVVCVAAGVAIATQEEPAASELEAVATIA